MKSNLVKDTRLVGSTSENIFLSLLNDNGVLATSFDTAGLDGVVYDLKNKYFKVGNPPYYVQIKCRGSKSDKFNPQGHSILAIDKIRSFAKQIQLPESSLYFVVGFYKNNDIRTITFFSIPFRLLRVFKGTDHYRFSVTKCEEATNKHKNIFYL
jgi:hypothetical protein